MAKTKKTETALTLEEKLEKSLVADWEQPYKVPDNWCWTALKSISNLYNGDRGSNYPSKKDYVSEGVPFINAGAIQNNTLDETEFNYITQQKYDTLRAGKIQKNDILYCLRGSLGKTAIIETDMIGAISSSLCIIRAKRDVQPKYLAYLLRTGLVAQQQYIAENGSAQPNLSAASVMEYKLPISPFNEQQRIVDRIEKMFSKLDEVKENVQNVIDGFENRKSAILHKAFSGELTAKWRKEHNINIEEWCKSPINDVCTLRSGSTIPVEEELESGKIPYVKVADMNLPENSICITTSSRFVNECSANHSIPYGSTIFPKRGGAILTNKKRFVAVKEIIADLNTMAIIPDSLKLNDWYCYYWMLSIDLRTLNNGSNVPQINNKDMFRLSIPVPPLPEQQEIVRILDDLLYREQRAKEKAEEALERIELIKKSILARAFRGELGTNNPDEESSLELLKSILSEDKDEKHVTKPRSKRVSIPAEVKAMLSNHLEKDILKLFYKAKSNEVSIDDIMSVSSNKFEIMDALKALEEKKLVSKKANGIYKLAR